MAKKIKICKACGAEIPPGLNVCPKCYAINRNPNSTVWWVLFALLTVGAVTFLPSFTSIFFFAAAAFILPVEKVQELWRRKLPIKQLKYIIPAALFIIGCVLAPSTHADDSEPRDSDSIPAIIVAADGKEPTLDSSTDIPTETDEDQESLTTQLEESVAEDDGTQEESAREEDTVAETPTDENPTAIPESEPESPVTAPEPEPEPEPATPAATPEPEQAQKTEVPVVEITQSYIGNKNSKKFHATSCNSLPKEKNRVYFNGRQAAVDSGYTPCGKCHP